jgi:hypothetical protein
MKLGENEISIIIIITVRIEKERTRKCDKQIEYADEELSN